MSEHQNWIYETENPIALQDIENMQVRGRIINVIEWVDRDLADIVDIDISDVPEWYDSQVITKDEINGMLIKSWTRSARS